MFAGKKSAQIREILISESAWEEMTCLFAPSLTYLKLSTHFWGSRESYFGFAIAGILFLIMHCRYCAKNVVIKNDGLAPMRELINIRRSGLTSPFIWLSRAGYLGFFIGMLH
ncbi:Uncharacterised protein [Klebsiella pneumoniae]|nr:Uncharacterised protein [Klebsiella pneumoniae]